MFLSSNSFSRSRVVLRLSVGLGLSLISVPAAMAVTTAIATASLSFNVASPQGALGFSSPHLNGTAALNAGPPATEVNYWDTGSGSVLSGSDSIGGNSVSLSSSFSGRSFTSNASVSLSLPPFVTAEGSASSFNFVNIDTLNIVPVNDTFDLKFTSVRALLNLSLGADDDGATAFGGASWFIGLRYTLPGDADSGLHTRSVSRELGSDESWLDSNSYSGYTGSFTFSSIPAAAMDIQLYWETTADARALDGGGNEPLPVPDGGTSFLFLGTGLAAVESMRRKLRKA